VATTPNRPVGAIPSGIRAFEPSDDSVSMTPVQPGPAAGPSVAPAVGSFVEPQGNHTSWTPNILDAQASIGESILLWGFPWNGPFFKGGAPVVPNRPKGGVVVPKGKKLRLPGIDWGHDKLPPFPPETWPPPGTTLPGTTPTPPPSGPGGIPKDFASEYDYLMFFYCCYDITCNFPLENKVIM
jgi:hypothetical protein